MSIASTCFIDERTVPPISQPPVKRRTRFSMVRFRLHRLKSSVESRARILRVMCRRRMHRCAPATHQDQGKRARRVLRVRVRQPLTLIESPRHFSVPAIGHERLALRCAEAAVISGLNGVRFAELQFSRTHTHTQTKRFPFCTR